jgi:serine protease
MPDSALRLTCLLLAGASLAACDQRTRDLPTGAGTETGGARLAPLVAAAGEAVPGRYVVVMRAGEVGSASAAASEVVRTHGGRVHHTYSTALNGFAATLPPAAVDALRRNPNVEYVAEDGMAYPDQTTQPDATWGLDRIDQRVLPLNTRYVYGRTGAGVRVYVIDSGIVTSHNEFGTRASPGTDLVGDGSPYEDCNGHGTHVAGTIAGGTYGVAKGARLISVRVFGCTGGAEWSRIIAAVEWVTAHAVKPAVVNMSLGGGYYAPVNTAVANSIAAGLVYAVAAGNNGLDACGHSPASTPAAITVGATAGNDARSSFSNWGGCVDLFAPGSGITSAWWTTIEATNTMSGTSMATPHVAGVAALYLQESPAATPATVAAHLLATSTAGQVANAGEGSPNRLLFSQLTLPTPYAVVALNPGALGFTLVRTAGGAAVQPATETEEVRQSFMASGPGTAKAAPAGLPAGQEAAATSRVLSAPVVLSNPGTVALDWTVASNRPWLTADPAEGTLNSSHSTLLNTTVDGTGLAPGTHTGAVTVSAPGATNTPMNLPVTVTVVDAPALLVGTPRTGLAGVVESLTYFAVNVPAGAPSLTISTSGGTGDADLYVRHGSPPTASLFDCRPYHGGNVESCQVSAPLTGTYYVMLRASSAYTGLTLSASVGGPPAAPANVSTRSVSASAVQTTWTDASVNEQAFYVSRRSQTGEGAWTEWVNVGGSGANAVSFTNHGLTGGVPYQFRVRTCNVAGCSAWLAGDPVTIPTAPPPEPFNLAATAFSATGAAVTWADGSSDETGFRLARALRNLDGTWSGYVVFAAPGANVALFNNTGLLAGRQYRYQLQACNPVGCSAWASSNVLTMPTPPGVPTGVAGTPLSSSSIRVQWTDGSGAETSFEVARAPVTGGVAGSFAHVATVPAAAGVYSTVLYNNAGLAVGTYRYRVRSCNLAGCSAWITSGNVLIPAAPGVPGAFRGTALSPSSIRLMWDDPGTETSIQVHRALQNPDGSWPAYASVATLGANVLSFDNTGLLSSRVYRYQVRGCNLSGCSAWAVGIPITTPNP